ncbi:alpha/beta hydrolase [Psychrobacillus sp. OK032]|uniref:alpha/beta hydrolase n=1 Tax=Psychrobacillus sp. OK032 TaxID=1884358 RepID=UPI0008C13B33|nr:dienelactone hydrolase family protein [Psychrobacillus sp. OK032]SES10355.1 phospholipase/carboxylesterase [Psychrobacillus sp. OK032]
MNTTFTYTHSAPPTTDKTKKYPALFLMHGMGSNEQDLVGLVSSLKNKCHIFSIRGPINQPPGYAYFTIEGFGKPHRTVFDQVVKDLQSFIENTIEEFPIDSEQIYLFGFSQGAILSQSLALVMGNVVKGIVALSGYIPAFVKEEYAIQPVDKLNAFISHGELDNKLPFEWGVASKDYFTEQGANVTFKSYPVAHGVSSENHQDLIAFLEANIS